MQERKERWNVGTGIVGTPLLRLAVLNQDPALLVDYLSMLKNIIDKIRSGMFVEVPGGKGKRLYVSVYLSSYFTQLGHFIQRISAKIRRKYGYI